MTKPARKTAALKALARQWTPFARIEITPDMRAQYALLRHCHSLYSNSRMEVQCFAIESSIGGVMQVTLKRHGNVEEVTEDDMRRTLLELFGPAATAVEIYRAIEEKWKIRILWILPATWKLPFGMHLSTAFGRPPQ